MISGVSRCRYCVYGLLAREAGCFENLTPWLKLLPCSDDEGLAALVDRAASCTAQHLSFTVSAQLRQPALCELAAASLQGYNASSAESKASCQTAPVQYSIRQTMTMVSDASFALPWPDVEIMHRTAGALSNMTTSRKSMPTLLAEPAVSSRSAANTWQCKTMPPFHRTTFS